MMKLQIIGHLGKDCEVRDVNGKKVMNYSVAHTEKYTDNQGQVISKTTWVDCAHWTDKTAVSQYLKKGTQVYIEGIPEVRTWESNGKHGASFQCRVIAVNLLGSRQESQPAATGQASQSEAIPEAANDLPF